MSESKIPRLIITFRHPHTPGFQGGGAGHLVLPNLPDLDVPEIVEGEDVSEQDGMTANVLRHIRDGTQGVHLLPLPHRNIVPADYWVRIEGNPTVQMYLKAGMIQVVGVADEAALTRQETLDLQSDLARAQRDVDAMKAKLEHVMPGGEG